MSNKKLTSRQIDAFLLCLISLSYAGLSSGIFFGIRVVDILLLLGILYKATVKISVRVWILLGLWGLSVAASTLIGILDKTPYLLSDLRFFISFGMGFLLASSMAKNASLRLVNIFYFLVFSSLLIYIIIPLFPAVRFYYIPKIFQSQEHKNTIFGPSLVLINYLYIYLVFKDRNRPYIFYVTYLVFMLLIFTMRISRMSLVIMVGLLLWSLGYRLIHRIKFTYILTGLILCAAGVIFITQTHNQRIKGIFHPEEDTSFNYRILSNNAFLADFNRAAPVNQLLGYGMGSTFLFNYNAYLGRRVLNILDNTPLTVLMKTGYLGVLIYFIIVLYPLIYVNWHRRLVLFFPILLTMLLFDHALYNVLYIFAVYFVALKLKTDRERLLASSPKNRLTS